MLYSKGCAEMTWMEIVNVLPGIVYLIYSILWRNKVTYFSRRYSKTSKMTINKSKEFLKLQFKISILNSIYLIIYGIFLNLFNLNGLWLILGILPFHFINLLLILRSKKLGYVNYEIANTYK